MKYRAEIDGLRTIAVIPVILFHAGFEYFSGGFIGVDVFFVISGYLITTIILSEKEKGTFTLANFYERRARRILPALFLVMFVSLPFAWFWFTPSDMEDFSKSLIAVSCFFSNIHFLKESGYWEIANELKPLLHTWSLAVEEQYYIIFPLFLMLMWRFRKRWILSSFMMLAALSLFASQWAAYNEPTANFFLLPTRAWELAIGASIAFYFLYRKQAIRTLLSHKIIDEILGLVGLIMIGSAVFIFDETVPFPGFFALIPTIGAGLIIVFSSSKTIVGRLLGTKVLVGIGLISYSAYLWHQPLFAFARYRSPGEPGKLLLFCLAALAFPLAYLSWRYVEKPFRRKDGFSRKLIFTFAITGSVLFILFGLAGEKTDGFSYRYFDSQQAMLSYLKYDFKDAYREGSCFLRKNQTYSDFKDECFSSDNGEDSILLWGDSHAAALSYGLRKNFRNVTQLTTSGCTPLIGYDPIKGSYCLDINNFVLRKIEQLKPEVLILHANWSEPLPKIEVGLKEALSRTILHIKSIAPKTRIIVLGGVPQWKPSLPSLLAKFYIDLKQEAYVYSHCNKKVQDADQILLEVAEATDTTFISLLDIFCKNGECLSSVKQDKTYEPFVWDYGHLTKLSSSLVSKEILFRIDANNEGLQP